jgi:hypothetical protein
MTGNPRSQVGTEQLRNRTRIHLSRIHAGRGSPVKPQRRDGRGERPVSATGKSATERVLAPLSFGLFSALIASLRFISVRPD